MNKEQERDDTSAAEPQAERGQASEEEGALPRGTALPDREDAIVYMEFPGFGSKRMLLIW